ncbi:MAG: hypothetical protein PHX20_07560 [Candidatus Omnitrophica bacterium]|nr:hypothetical protein [Candidatus Omnitrophota bacterium]
MSKIIETMTSPFKKEKTRSSAQEEIAKIYLKVSDKNKNRREKASKLPWIIAGLALVVAVLTLLFKSNIDVKVRILGEIPSIGSDGSDKFGSLREKGLYLSKGGELNKYLIKNADFSGDAKLFSKVTGDEITLCNSRGSGWANYEIYLREPLNLRKLDVRYMARGESGDEYLTVVIVDSDNRSYRVEKDMSSKLSKDWQAYTINFKPLRNVIDLANISVIRFEFGTLTAGNSSTATLFVKDICVTKTKRMGL